MEATSLSTSLEVVTLTAFGLPGGLTSSGRRTPSRLRSRATGIIKEAGPSEHRVRRWILAGAFAALLAAGVAAILRIRVSDSPGSSSVPEVTEAAAESAVEPLAEVSPLPAGPSRKLAPALEPAAERSPAALSSGALRKGVLAGRVVDGYGGPIAAARIRIAATDPADEGSEEPPKTVFSGGDGAFRLEGLGEGPYLLVANAEGRRSEVLRDLRPDADHLEIVLSVQRVIAGRVLDADTGEPVVRFRVEASGVTHFPSKSRGSISSDFTSEDGAFVIPDPGDSIVDLRFEAEGFASEGVGLMWNDASEARKDVEVKLRRVLAIRGTVVDEQSGAPVEGARVESWSPSDTPSQWGWVQRTDADGSFASEEFRRGARLRVRHDAYVDAATETLGMHGEESLTGLVVRLSRGGAVEGYAPSAGGTPYVGGTATAQPEAFPPNVRELLLKTGEVGGSGYFLIRGLEPGNYRVEVSPPSSSSGDEAERRRRTLQAAAIVEAGKTTRVDFDARAAEGCIVRGRVFRGGEPVEGAGVEIRRNRETPGPGIQWASDTSDETGKDGVFEIRNIAPGEATLSVSTMGEGVSDVGWWTVEVPASGVLVFDAHLAGAEIRGRVSRASDGRGVAGARVGVWQEQEGMGVTGQGGGVVTDLDGRYRVRGLRAGAYTVSVDLDSLPDGPEPSEPQLAAPRSRRQVRVAPDEVVTVDFALESGGTVLVRVVDPSGAPLAGEEVILYPEKENRTGGLKTGFTNAVGVARIAGVSPGRVLAALLRPEYSSQLSDQASVRAGEEVEIRLELKRPVTLRLRVLGPGDAPVEGAFVSVVGTATGKPRGGGGLSDETGGFVLHLVPGDYAVVAKLQGFAPSSTTIRVGADSAQEAVVRLEREPPPK